MDVMICFFGLDCMLGWVDFWGVELWERRPLFLMGGWGSFFLGTHIRLNFVGGLLGEREGGEKG